MGISVIMSVYKSEKGAYLDGSFRSIWTDQKLKPKQIVLVEDGHLTDELYSVIDKWEKILNNHLLILKNEENIGLTKSLNKALKVVTEDYIARMDSDDISMPNRFLIQAKYLDTHQDVAVVGGSLQEFDENNECLNVRHYPQSTKESKQYIHKASPLAHPTVMMRKSIFDNGLKYDERYRTSQDLALWFDVLNSGFGISNVPEVTIKFRRAGDIYKRRGRAKAFNEFKIYMRGIRRMDGILSLKYIYPISRLIFRLMPQGIVKFIYGSSIRKRVLERSVNSQSSLNFQRN